MNERERAEASVARDIEHDGRNPDDYNVPAIAEKLNELSGSWHLDTIDEQTFWSIVDRRNTATGAPVSAPCPQCDQPWCHHWIGDTGGTYCPNPAMNVWVTEQIAGIVGICEALGFDRERIVNLIKRAVEEL